jgi:chemotaxis signal transduction protein
MSSEEEPAAETALRFRSEFDRSFASPPRLETALFEDLLAVRVAEDPHVFRLGELAGLHADRRIVPVPSQRAELLGISGFRNTIVPIYDLRVLLGYPNGPPPRWLVLARGSPTIGFAFDRMEGLVRLPRDVVSLSAGADGNRKHVRGAVHTDAARPIIHVASLLEAIARRA